VPVGASSAQRERADRLRQLHRGPPLLVLPNAWDVASARVIEAAGAQAIASSSAGVAYALGYPDGQRISRDEMLEMVRRIAGAVEVPVSADVEAGYGVTAEAAAATARAVVAAGAVGMNLEDAAEAGELLALDLQLARIQAVRAASDAAGIPLVLNARTDAFAAHSLAGEARTAEAIRRGNAFLAAGADCVFVPFVSEKDAIARLAREIHGPLNILASPASPPPAELEKLGVRRVSVGSAIARAAYGLARSSALELLRGRYPDLAGAIPYAELQALLAARR
jgi:2-methylisocitrate lyase-like PEP mutase family enzyme